MLLPQGPSANAAKIPLKKALSDLDKSWKMITSMPGTTTISTASDYHPGSKPSIQQLKSIN